MLESAGGQCVGGELQGACYSAAPLLKIANSIWLDNGDTLSQEYQAVVGEYVKQIDLEAQDRTNSAACDLVRVRARRRTSLATHDLVHVRAISATYKHAHA